MSPSRMESNRNRAQRWWFKRYTKRPPSFLMFVQILFLTIAMMRTTTTAFCIVSNPTMRKDARTTSNPFSRFVPSALLVGGSLRNGDRGRKPTLKNACGWFDIVGNRRRCCGSMLFTMDETRSSSINEDVLAHTNNVDGDHSDDDDDDDDDEDAEGIDDDEIPMIVEETDEDEDFFTAAERKASPPIDLPKGVPDGFYVVEQYPVPLEGLPRVKSIRDETNDDDDDDSEPCGVRKADLIRLGIMDGTNVTLPVALMVMDPVEYPSFSKARKACRKGYILIHQGPLPEDGVFDPEKCTRGRVRNRVFPGDVVAKQLRMGGGFYPSDGTLAPPFELPVVYEDDHFAIVDKPAGIVVYSHRKGGHGRNTVRAALPFALQPPRRGTRSILRRPTACHRLDRPTSGLLLVAKTKPAMVEITRQFVERIVRKTYMAVVNGVPDEPKETEITTEAAEELGVDVGEELKRGDVDIKWQVIDCALVDKQGVSRSAVTVWRPIQYVKSLKANDGVLTLVELKPKTGRYHQLRRHMSWERDCPIVGDVVYDGGREDAVALRERGLFLCSNKVCLQHPYFNTVAGREEWNALPDSEKWADGKIRLAEDGSTVEVHVEANLPEKFANLLSREGERHAKFYGD